jgi:hypothetical protein
VGRESANKRRPHRDPFDTHSHFLTSHFSLASFAIMDSSKSGGSNHVRQVDQGRDEALEQAKQQNKPVLIDFSAAPG